MIWGFKPAARWFRWDGPFASHRDRPKLKPEDSHPIWASVSLLQDMGLLLFCVCVHPQFFENDTETAEPVHPYGIGEGGEVPIEREIGDAADLAARTMALSSKLKEAEDEGFEYFCPVLKTLPSTQMIGVARLTYRPHTRRTKGGSANLN